MKQDRREFLLKSCSALTMTAMATQMRHFGMMSVQAQTRIDEQQVDQVVATPSDYRALVCVFLAGGNDGNNTVIPIHGDANISNYTSYSTLRGVDLALTQSALAATAINVPRMGGLAYALHPSLKRDPVAQPINGTTVVNDGIHGLWAASKMAIVANVGTLIVPTTRTNYNSVKKPYQLFSHSDQISQYQGGRSDISSFTGWGGRIADLRNAADNQNGLIPMVTSISGAQLFTSGQATLPMAIADANTTLANVLNPAGFANNAAGNARKLAFNNLRGVDLSSSLVTAASHITDQAISANAALQTALDVTTTFPNTSIGRQLKQVARLIKTRAGLQVNRQVFFVQIGGFDTHSDQPATQVSLLFQLGQAMRAFYDEMSAQTIADKVTQFTMADFSRTLSPAGSGSGVGTDHAWGNHHFVIGGGITGSDFYGMNSSNGTPFPQLVLNAADDSDTGTSGRWIPATSIEQYGATLARWFGVPDANMSSIFPKIGNFTTTDLAFMQPPAP